MCVHQSWAPRALASEMDLEWPKTSPRRERSSGGGDPQEVIYRHLAGVPGEFGLDLPSRARQSLWWSRGLWLERDLPRKRVTRAGARLPGEERERGTSLVSRHAGACTAVQKLSQPLEWLRSRPSRRVDKRGGGQ